MFSKGITSIKTGAIITMAMRWTDRLIGLFSTLILARLLLPEDFGIIAMASLVVGLTDIMLSLSVNVALIQNKHATQDHYDTAWTLRLLQTCAAGLIIILIAPIAAEYFRDDRIKDVLRVLGIFLPLVGLENIGITTFQKEMRFGLDFKFLFIKRISGFATTMVIALLLQSYWAMVAGTVAGRIVGVMTSYLMHPMRPKLSFSKMREILQVSQWMLVKNTGQYLNAIIHKLIAGRYVNASLLGGYSLADEISRMPTSEILSPINRVLFPAFVASLNDLRELKRKFLLAQNIQCLFGIPAGIGLALIAQEAIQVLLGEKWIFIVPFLQILALAAISESIGTTSGYILITMGRARLSALISWMQVIMFCAIALIYAPVMSLLHFATLRLAAMLFGLTLSLWFVVQTLNNLSIIEILKGSARPIIGSTIMAAVIYGVAEFFTMSPLSFLIIKILLGAMTYIATVWLLWCLTGMNAGAESFIKENFVKGFGRRAKMFFLK